MVQIASLIIATSMAVGRNPDPSFYSLFDVKEYQVTEGRFDGMTFGYRLFVPQGADRGRTRFPLIVWLHGVGERGENNVGQLKRLDTLVFLPPREKSQYSFFFLAVQCPYQLNWSDSMTAQSSRQADDMLEVTKKVLLKTIEEEPIDRDRVYLVGLSSGGTASWELTIRNPEVFAAVAPLASCGALTSGLEKLRMVPVWAFHSSGDIGPPPGFARGSVSRLQREGGVALLTELNGGGHNCWDRAFADHDLLNWLLAQRRGDPMRLPPGSVLLRTQIARALSGWTMWQLLLQVLVVLFIVYALVRAGKAWVRNAQAVHSADRFHRRTRAL